MMRSSFLLLISLAAAAQAAPPPRVEISYEVRHNGSAVAEVVERLEHGAGEYRLSETWRGKGIYAMRGEIRRSSRGSVTARGLLPREFTDQRTGRNTARASFDWKAKTLTQQYKGAPRTEPLPPNAHDRLAFLYEFAFDPPRDGPVTLALVDGRGVSTHVYRREGRERVATPAGEFDAVRMVRRKEGSDERVEIWLASQKSLLPVRILVVQKDGTRIDQVATRISAP
jgi:hypothetical protein